MFSQFDTPPDDVITVSSGLVSSSEGTADLDVTPVVHERSVIGLVDALFQKTCCDSSVLRPRPP